MAEGNASGGHCKSRPALGDVTNRMVKSGFSGREKDFDFRESDAAKRARVSPRPCSEINSLKDNVISNLSKIPNENRDSHLYNDCDGFHCLKGKHIEVGNPEFNAGCDKCKILDHRGGTIVSQSVNELAVVDIDSGDMCSQTELSKHSRPNTDDVAAQNRLKSIGNEADDCSLVVSMKQNNILGAAEVSTQNKCSSFDFAMFGTNSSANTEAKTELGGSSPPATSRIISEAGDDFIRDGQNCYVDEEIISLEGTQSDINDRHNDLDDHNTDNFVMSQSGSIDCAALPQSQESRVFGVDKSTESKDECAHNSQGSNAIKACSCLFCTKAAYILLDLHQKDIKARLSALKRSQKEASILAERSFRMKVNQTRGVESSNGASKLESHLVYQWSSLFNRMSDIWEAEINQLEASLLPLNNLRDKCRSEMEFLTDKQPEQRWELTEEARYKP